MADVDKIGGIPVALKELLTAGLLHGDCMTVTGYTVAENLSNVPSLGELQNVLYHVDKPWAPAGRHIIILKVRVYLLILYICVCVGGWALCVFAYHTLRNLQETKFSQIITESYPGIVNL